MECWSCIFLPDTQTCASIWDNSVLGLGLRTSNNIVSSCSCARQCHFPGVHPTLWCKSAPGASLPVTVLSLYYTKLIFHWSAFRIFQHSGILANVHSLSLDSSKSNSRAKASAGLFLQAGCKCCHRAYPVSRSNEGWVGKPGYQCAVLITPEMMTWYSV